MIQYNELDLFLIELRILCLEHRTNNLYLRFKEVKDNSFVVVARFTSGHLTAMNDNTNIHKLLKSFLWQFQEDLNVLTKKHLSVSKNYNFPDNLEFEVIDDYGMGASVVGSYKNSKIK